MDITVAALQAFDLGLYTEFRESFQTALWIKDTSLKPGSPDYIRPTAGGCAVVHQKSAGGLVDVTKKLEASTCSQNVNLIELHDGCVSNWNPKTSSKQRWGVSFQRDQHQFFS